MSASLDRRNEVLAEELDTNLVFSTDRRDFDVYRINGRKRFRIAP